MHPLPKVAALLLFTLALANGAWAEENHASAVSQNSARQGYQHARVLNTDEGLAIIGAALEFRHHNRTRPDCSHFVNTIYQKAGFPYNYANSIELFSGTDAFRRVIRPQPGDLIVWKGHVGIVIQPTQHTFFSALRTGLGVEDYQSPYWKKRGRPRFFRYIQVAPPAILAADTRLLNVKTDTTNTESLNDEDAEAALNDTDSRVSEESDAEGMSAAVAPAPVNNATAGSLSFQSQKPRPEDVRVVLLRKFNDVEQALRGQDVLRSEQAVTVFESLDVKKVHVKGNTGWAEVRIKRISSLAQGQAKVKTYSEKRRFSLTRRDAATWEVILPSETIYVPREAAVRLFAHQLASITDRPDPDTSDREKVQLARLLNALLQNPAR